MRDPPFQLWRVSRTESYCYGSHNFCESHRVTEVHTRGAPPGRHIQSSATPSLDEQAYNGTMSTANRATIAIVGAGPRGASLLERIGANLGDDAPPIDVHVIDPAPSGAGRIWHPEQSRELCMNTLSHAVTLFTEPGSSLAGPVIPGPTLYEWSVLSLHAEFPSDRSVKAVAAIPSPHVAAFEAFPPRQGFAADFRDELEATLPESHPSRALYGEYLSWCYERAVALLPPNARVIRHRTTAVGIERHSSRERIQLAAVGEHGAGWIEADAVILATGWMPRSDTAAERAIAHELERRPELVWVRPASPIEQDLSRVPAGEPAIVRGIGMGFFDAMALLTIGRGGAFAPDPDTTSGLRYLPSGREPVLHATSHRGVPFRAKSLYHSLPPNPQQRLLLGVDWAAIRRPIDFDRVLWPRIVADAYIDHVETLHRVRPTAVAASPREIRAAIIAALDELLHDATPDPAPGGDDLDRAPASIAAAVAPFIPNPADRFDLLGEMHPAERDFASPEAFDTFVRERTAADLREAELGRDSAVKAGLWSISAARGAAARIGTLGGFDAESRGSGYALLTSLGGMVGSGPPAFRNRQLLALADAGLVRFVGPHASVHVSDEGFVAESARVAGSRVVAPALVDGWMHFHRLDETVDPLARTLLDAGRARPFRVAARDGAALVTGAFEIDAATGRLIGSDGRHDPAVHVAGIPVDEQLHGTIISPMPGTDPPMLRETDRIARSALGIALARTDQASPHGTAPHPQLEGALHV